MSQIYIAKNLLIYLIAIFSLFVVGVVILSLVFPALIISTLGIHENSLDPFEIGFNGIFILLGNFTILTFGLLYYKNYLPDKIHFFISKLFQKIYQKK